MWQLMIRSILAAAVLLGCSCSDKDEPDKPLTETFVRGSDQEGIELEDITYCGSELSTGAVSRFVAKLSSIVTGPDAESVDASNLYYERVSFWYSGFRHDAYRDRLEDYDGRALEIRDWREILVRLRANQLEDGGYRGCMLDNGKVWFQADSDGELKLSAANLDRGWGN